MRLLPRTLFGRLLLLMAGGLIVAQLIGATLHLVERQRVIARTVSGEFAQRVAAVYRAIDHQPATGQAGLARLLSLPRQQLAIGAAPPAAGISGKVAAAAAPGDDSGFLARVRETLGREVAVHAVRVPDRTAFAFDLYLRLSSGNWLRIHGQAPEEIFALPVHHFMTLGLMLLTVFVLVWLIARMAIRPLTELARAADTLAVDLKRPPLPEAGPLEVRTAVRAFNAMQQRISTGIEERERFLAAVSHDLKTPVTRLRLRSEMLADPRLRERFARDLDEMQGMLDSALDFLHGRAADEAVQPLDLTALLESLVDDYAEIGERVPLSAPESLRIQGRPQALRRALGNLVDNALKYGGQASVGVELARDGCLIHVDDAGPGLPAEELARVFEPFYRLESSRSRETGGVGLGLAIVRQIARDHGGEVHLENRPAGGLRAVLWLPRAG